MWLGELLNGTLNRVPLAVETGKVAPPGFLDGSRVNQPVRHDRFLLEAMRERNRARRSGAPDRATTSRAGRSDGARRSDFLGRRSRSQKLASTRLSGLPATGSQPDGPPDRKPNPLPA